MKDFAMLILRLAVGGLMAGHGAQKLFGKFGGHGMAGFTGMIGSMGMKPPKAWALVGAISEFGGGVLTGLGALNPLGPIGIIGSMSIATAKVHWNKPIWNTEGGAELPVLNIAAALAMATAGPGKYSLDHLIGRSLPRRLVLVPGLVLVGASVAYLVMSTRQPETQQQTESEQLQDQQHDSILMQAVNIDEMPTSASITPEPHRTLEQVGLEYPTDEQPGTDGGDNFQTSP